MLVFDQLKKNDPQLRMLTAGVLAGLCVLLAGLWWIQIVSAQDYQQHLETQAFRTVRIPAVRGKILDRNGLTLAENAPDYSVSLYLDDLRDEFSDEYKRLRRHKYGHDCRALLEILESQAHRSSRTPAAEQRSNRRTDLAGAL